MIIEFWRTLFFCNTPYTFRNLHQFIRSYRSYWNDLTEACIFQFGLFTNLNLLWNSFKSVEPDWMLLLTLSLNKIPLFWSFIPHITAWHLASNLIADTIRNSMLGCVIQSDSNTLEVAIWCKQQKWCSTSICRTSTHIFD